MNTRDITTLSDDELRAEADALTRDLLAAWHRKRDAQEVWETLSERKADVTIELAKRYNGVKQAVERG
jgi:hypothetical protein